MPKGHPLPFRLLSACFGKPGASATVARSLSPRSAKRGTAASPLYGIFSAFLGLGSDTRGLRINSFTFASILCIVVYCPARSAPAPLLLCEDFYWAVRQSSAAQNLKPNASFIFLCVG